MSRLITRRPRISTIVLTVLFLAVLFLYYLVRPITPATQGSYAPASVSSPTPSVSSPTPSASPSHTPSRKPRPRRSPEPSRSATPTASATPSVSPSPVGSGAAPSPVPDATPS